MGAALEDWLGKNRQYEEFTDNDGRPCRVSDDSLEEVVMFKSDEYPTYEDLFDRLSSFASTKHSLHISRRELNQKKPVQKDPNAMDIGAVSKGKGKSKDVTCYRCGRPGHRAADCRSGGKGGKAGRGAQYKRMDNVQCWVCNGYGHYGKDCRHRSKGGGKDKGKDNKGGKNNKGKGYGGNATSSVDDAQPAGEPDPKDLAHLDLCAVDGGVGMDYGSSSRSEEENMGVEVEEEKPDYLVEYDGEEWIRFNYDSGAVSTVIPVEMAEEDLELHRVGDFKVANGDRIPRYGLVRMKVMDERGNKRGIRATVTHVHKPLGSAGEFSRNHDAWLWKDGGVLLPRHGALATRMRNVYKALCNQYSDDQVIPLYKEGNLYNFYVQKRGKMDEVCAIDSSSSSSSGNSRQGHL